MPLITFEKLSKILTFCFNNFFLGPLDFSLGRAQVLPQYYINYYNEKSVHFLLIEMFEKSISIALAQLIWPSHEILAKNNFIYITIDPQLGVKV